MIRQKKVKWSRYRPGVAQRVGRGIALFFHDRGTIRGWVVSSKPRPHFTPGKDSVPILQEAGWVPGPVWTGGKSRPHRDSIPDCPDRSQSLYRSHKLRYTCIIMTKSFYIPHARCLLFPQWILKYEIPVFKAKTWGTWYFQKMAISCVQSEQIAFRTGSCKTDHYKFDVHFIILKLCAAGPRGRAVKQVGLRLLVCWDCGFESCREHKCLSLVNAVCCQVEISKNARSFAQRFPTVPVSVCVSLSVIRGNK